MEAIAAEWGNRRKAKMAITGVSRASLDLVRGSERTVGLCSAVAQTL